jgi:hypothetical protein
LTSIEGVPRDELKSRCVWVDYFLPEGGKRTKRKKVEDAIRNERHAMFSALAEVLREYLTVREDPAAHEIAHSINPIPRFVEHFIEVCYLLIAYCRVRYGAGAGDALASEIIHGWTAIQRDEDSDETVTSSLEEHVLHVLGSRECDARCDDTFEWNGQRGVLYIVYSSALLGALQRQRIAGLDLPNDANGMTARLRSDTFQRFKVLGEKDGVPVLKRGNQGVRLGIFVPKEDAAE